MSFTIYRGYRIRPTGLSESRAFCVELHEETLGRFLRLKYTESKASAIEWIDQRLVGMRMDHL